MCPTPSSPDWLPLAKFAVQLGTLIGAVGVAAAALWQAGTARKRHEAQTTADRERRITESFAKAVEQLGSDKLETRLGAIYTLERISLESEREYWPIMETLTAFVRERALWQPRRALANPFGGEIELTPRPTTDIQAVLTVLGRRDETARKQDEVANRHLDLTAMDLRGANLRGAHLEGAMLAGALEGASLWEAHLKGAKLIALLKNVNLRGSDLEGADLRGSDLEGADLEGAHLSKAHIEGVDLRDVAGLTQEQVNSALGNEETRLPEGLTPPPHWPAAAPDAPDNAK